MPIYEYECENCGETFQRLYMSPEDRPEEIACPGCDSSDVHQIFSPPTVHSGEATDVVEEAAEQMKEERGSQPRSFDQRDLREAL
jgi:putative FmdB family regulatory protein